MLICVSAKRASYSCYYLSLSIHVCWVIKDCSQQPCLLSLRIVIYIHLTHADFSNIHVSHVIKGRQTDRQTQKQYTYLHM